MSWIDIENKKPNEGDNVILLDSHKQIHIGFLYRDTLHEDLHQDYTVVEVWRDRYDDQDLEEITHWMPLPELPHE